MVSIGLAACSLEPIPQHHLTPEQLAGQAYLAGQALRFGNDRITAVRTYPVVQVTRRYCQGSGPGMVLYYAKGQSVVAFAKQKTGPWYRLP